MLTPSASPVYIAPLAPLSTSITEVLPLRAAIVPSSVAKMKFEPTAAVLPLAGVTSRFPIPYPLTTWPVGVPVLLDLLLADGGTDTTVVLMVGAVSVAGVALDTV